MKKEKKKSFPLVLRLCRWCKWVRHCIVGWPFVPWRNSGKTAEGGMEDELSVSLPPHSSHSQVSRPASLLR